MELIHWESRGKARALPASGRPQTLVTVDHPASCAAVYVTEFSAPRFLTGPYVRLDLVAEVNGARARIASALLRSTDLNASDLVISASGFPAQKFHVEVLASAPEINVGVALVTGCGCGAPFILVPPKYQQAANDTPAAFLLGLPASVPQLYRYATGSGNALVNVPLGARVKSIYTLGGAVAGSVQITQGGIVGAAIPIPIGVPWAEQFSKSGEDQLAGPVAVTFVNSASFFVSWWQ